MEMLVSLSHEIRIEEQDVKPATQPTDQAQQALALKDQQRIVEDYGIDASPEEIEKGEKERTEQEEEKAEEAKKTVPQDLGQFKQSDDSENNAAKIQQSHDNLTDL